MQEPHRPGHLKQRNKEHKHGRHRSKGEISTNCKGKISLKVNTRKHKFQQSKNDRRHQAKMLRDKKKEEILLKKRQIGGKTTPPFLITVIPLGFSPVPEKLMDLIMDADPSAEFKCSKENVIQISVPRWKQVFSFVVPEKGNLFANIDAAKASDSIIFLISGQKEFELDDASEKLMTCLLTQGLPSTISVITDLEAMPAHKRLGIKQEVQKSLSRWLPDEKIISLEKNGDALTLLRLLGTQKQRSVLQRDMRPYLFVEELDVGNMDTEKCSVKLSGYLRGQNLSANGLVHITGWGDFQIDRIESFDSCDVDVMQVPDPNRQATLVSENVPDPMDAEQTWPTEEEISEAKFAKKLLRKVPKGTSDYQACWIPEEEEEEEDGGEEGSENEEDQDMDAEDDSDSNSEEWEERNESETVPEADKYDGTIDNDEEMEALQKLQAAREEEAFPDEVDTPRDIPARERFCKYRGLASFRTSPWDTKENLPPEYARIFQFENFARTKKRIMNELSEDLEGIPPGGYIRVQVSNVPVELVQRRKQSEPLVMCGLLPHEQKMSVLNFAVKRSSHSSYSQMPIKSKEPVVVHCGFRRYIAKPIYSQHTNGSKHKYERYFQPGATVIATLFAPITYPPASVLLFTEEGKSLLATGRVLSVNPDRLVIKRVVLSGHPFRVLKHSAIIRFMFFNREDIEWFKPVELRTKYGRRGHIKEPLGTHGHMKAVFDDQLKSQDTVMLNLYKRVFPPWYYEPKVPSPPPLYKLLKLSTIKEDEMET